jgi:hypothetical protein
VSLGLRGARVAQFSIESVNAFTVSQRAIARRKSTVRIDRVRLIANRSKEKYAARINADGVPALARACPHFCA